MHYLPIYYHDETVRLNLLIRFFYPHGLSSYHYQVDHSKTVSVRVLYLNRSEIEPTS